MARQLIALGAAPRSKIFLSIVYLRIGRDPEINNGAALGRVPLARCRVSGRTGRDPAAKGRALSASEVVAVADGTMRRRSRRAVPRPRVVQFSLTEEEFAVVSAAAGRLGLAKGAFAAEAALAAAGGGPAPGVSPVREALVEVMTAAGPCA
jgi:hypothetical protein